MGIVMPIYFEEYHGTPIRHLEPCFYEYCWLVTDHRVLKACDATVYNTQISLDTVMDFHCTLLYVHLWLPISFCVHDWGKSGLAWTLAAFNLLTLFQWCILWHNCPW
jgi:hypothetical protein